LRLGRAAGLLLDNFFHAGGGGGGGLLSDLLAAVAGDFDAGTGFQAFVAGLAAALGAAFGAGLAAGLRWRGPWTAGFATDATGFLDF
jgi:hypothetical protein